MVWHIFLRVAKRCSRHFSAPPGLQANRSGHGRARGGREEAALREAASPAIVANQRMLNGVVIADGEGLYHG